MPGVNDANKSKILAISDTHFSRREEALEYLEFLQSFDFDVLVHAGDFTCKECYLALKEFCEENGVEFLAVRGNCDRFDLQEIGVLEFPGLRLAAKHEPLMDDFSDLYYLARELEADVLVFGHIHRFAVCSSAPLVFCPGAVKNGQFALLEVSESLVLRFFRGGEEVDSAVFER